MPWLDAIPAGLDIESDLPAPRCVAEDTMLSCPLDEEFQEPK
jgi:hypothetical protein